MARTITISTSVFAAIWSLRQDGEETEDAILARLLEVAGDTKALVPSNLSGNADGGVYDGRNGVHFPEGFKAFRHYKGRKYEGIVRDRRWVRQDTGETYLSLNRLSTSITTGLENVWNGSWKYLDENGNIQPLSVKRGAC